MEFNRLLKKQIRRSFGSIDNASEEMMGFLSTVSESYDHYEKDRIMIERALELELKESNLEKESAKLRSKFKSDFLSMMSHEIRTPLNAVVGITNILLDECKQNDLIENMNTLKFSSDLLLSLINDILDFNKIEDGQVEFEKVEFDLHELLSNLEKSFSIKTKSTGSVDLIVEVDEELPKYLMGDSLRLSQILLNLVGNAIKFTHEGYIKIRLKHLKTEDNKVTIQFNIEDTGIGIPKEKHKLIFGSFSQADANTTRKYGGTGLGLSITKKILKLMDSRIQLESEVGVGSRFFFELTLDISTQVGPRKVVSKEITYFNNVKILLVEDNQINVLVAKRFLEKWGFEVDTAENGQIAVEKVLQHDYQLILMDLHMPVMDGYDASKTIRALKDPKFLTLPIIALTASADNFSKNRVFDCGMNTIVTKPFVPEELNQVLNQFLMKSVVAVE